MTDKQILLGRIIGPHGVKGEVKLKSFTENPLDVASYGAVTAPDGRRFTLLRPRVQGDIVVCAIKGVTDRNVAETLKALDLFVDREGLPETEEGEFYQADLIGMTVVDEKGTEIGKALGFQNFGAGDLLEIERTGGTTGFVPFADSIVPAVDVEGGRITISAAGLTLLDADEAQAKKAGAG